MSGEPTLQEQAETVAPLPNVVTISTGEEVTVYKCKVKQIGIVATFLATMMDQLGYNNYEDPEELEKLETRLSTPSALLSLIASNFESVANIAASLCSLTHEQFNELELEDAVAIVEEEVRINKDFFLKNLKPLMAGG